MSDFGLRIRDPATNKIVFDITTNVATFMGTFETGQTNGYVENAALSEGAPYLNVVSASGSTAYRPPTFSVAEVGGTWRLQWTFPNPGSPYNANCAVTYWVF